MRTLYDFHGGIHPPENKRQSNGAPIKAAPIPERLILPLSQHIGAPAEAVVAVGQRVLKGQVIAEAVGRVSVNIHAPTSGVIQAIGPHPVPHASGMEAPCILIEPDGRDEWIEHRGLADFKALGKAQLIDYIRAHGIAGMGGAGFPTDVKLHLGDDHIVNTLIINAAECEPYITADDMLMRERADQIIGGIEVMAHLLKPSHIMIGIEDNKPQAIRALEEAKRGQRLNIDVVVVPTKYPSGGEKQLIKLLTGVEVPSGRIPADVGIVCQNVGTASAIHRAVRHGEPLISRIVTVSGDAVAQRHNLEVLIGTPFRSLLDFSGVRRKDMYRMVMGGPMMGFAMTNEEVPVVKTTNCIIAATIDEMPPAPPANPCIRCGMCEQVCPAELLPQQLHWFAKAKEFDKAKHHNLFDCIECGACSYVCPSNIELVQYYRFAKAEIRAEEAEQRKADHARQRFEARQARIEQEAAEKEARRKARAEEAAKTQAVKKDAVERKTQAVAPEADVKALKTAAAVARTKLKKAQKALEQAREAGADNLPELQAELQAAEQKAAVAQQQLEQAEQGPVEVAAGPDLKALKTAAAVARTKLKKAQAALKMAEEKGQEGVEALRATVQQLETRAAEAQHAFAVAEGGSVQAAAPAVDPAPLKEEMEKARAKVEKAAAAAKEAAEKGLATAEKMQAGVEKLRGKYEEAKQAYEAAAQQAQGAAAAAVNLDELKADMDAARTKVDKARAAAEAAAQKGLPSADKMQAGVEKLRGKYDEARQAYEAAAKATGIGLAEAAAPAAAVDMKALKQQVSIMRTKLKKAEKQLAEAAAEDGAEVASLQAEVAELKVRHDEAKAVLDAAEQELIEAAAAEGVDLKQLKIDAALARAEVTKVERALSKIQDEGNDELEKLKASLLSAQQRADSLNQTLERFSQ